MQLINFDPDTATDKEQILYYKTLAYNLNAVNSFLESERDDAINHIFQLGKEINSLTEQIFESPYAFKKEHNV